MLSGPTYKFSPIFLNSGINYKSIKSLAPRRIPGTESLKKKKNLRIILILFRNKANF